MHNKIILNLAIYNTFLIYGTKNILFDLSCNKINLIINNLGNLYQFIQHIFCFDDNNNFFLKNN